MTDISRVAGGAQTASSDYVTTDQITIVGSGTTASPLHVAGEIVQGPITIHGASFQSSVGSAEEPQGTLMSLSGRTFEPQLTVNANAFATIPLRQGCTISTIDVVLFIEAAVVIAHLGACVDAATTHILASSPPSTAQPGLTVETITIPAAGVVVQPNTAYVIFVESQIAGKSYTISRATINP